MAIVEHLQSFLADCPLFAEFKRLYVDFLPEDTNTLSIEGVPANAIVRQYVDGSSERQYVFVVAARLFYSEETRNNIENSGIYEAFAEWLEEQSNNDNLPSLGEGKQATKIEAMSSGYLFDISGDLTNARYQIQCRLIYDQE